jgi:ribosomal protein S15P/S13E
MHRVKRVVDEYSARRKKRNDIAWHGKEHLTDRHSKRGLLSYRHQRVN